MRMRRVAVHHVDSVDVPVPYTGGSGHAWRRETCSPALLAAKGCHKRDARASYPAYILSDRLSLCPSLAVLAPSLRLHTPSAHSHRQTAC